MHAELKVQASKSCVRTLLSRRDKKAAVFRLSPLSASFNDYHDPRSVYWGGRTAHFLILD